MYTGLIIVAIALILYMGKRRAVFKLYRGYYAEKRRRFPWLENWIKQCGVNVEKIRADDDLTDSLIGTDTIYLIISFIVGAGLNFVIRFFVGSFLHNSNLAPSEIEYFLYMHTGSAIAILIAFIVAKVKLKESKGPLNVNSSEPDLSLECPSCGCPHSWVMFRKKHTVEREWEETTTTTRTTEYSYGGTSTTRSTDKTRCFDGKTYRNFKCYNCGHTYNGTYSNEWRHTRPNENEQIFDPPILPWSGANDIKKNNRRIKLILFAIFAVITAWQIKNFVKDAIYTKEMATHVHEATLDPSMNAITTSHYTGVTLRRGPSKSSEEIGRIPSGVFFTSYEKSGKYTRVKYKGQEGYVLSEAIKKLSKNRTATIIRRNTRVKYEPEIDAKERLMGKGYKVTLLGENDGGLIKIEFDGEVYWTSAYYLYW